MQALKESSPTGAPAPTRRGRWHHWLARATLAIGLSCGLGYGVADAAAHVYDPLDFVPDQVPAAHLSGSAMLRLYGKPVYAAKLFTDPNTFSPEDPTRSPFALDFEYRQATKGSAIAQQVASQMKDMGDAKTARISKWQQQLTGFLPDLSTDDHLTAVFQPSRGTFFFRNGQAIGTIGGNDFATAYFGLWLDERSTLPGMRQQLLKGAN